MKSKHDSMNRAVICQPLSGFMPVFSNEFIENEENEENSFYSLREDDGFRTGNEQHSLFREGNYLSRQTTDPA